MGDTKEQEREPPRAGRGNTVSAQGETSAPQAKPRAPHERDESADSQGGASPAIERMGAVAHDSATRGEQDTTKAQELDATYQRVRATGTPAPRGKPQRKPGER
jgi:hypothetical protein